MVTAPEVIDKFKLEAVQNDECILFSAAMVGDVNLYLNQYDNKHAAEIEVRPPSPNEIRCTSTPHCRNEDRYTKQNLVESTLLSFWKVLCHCFRPFYQCILGLAEICQCRMSQYVKERGLFCGMNMT